MEFNLLEDFYKCINLKDLDELMEKINIFSFVLPIVLFEIDFDEIEINNLINGSICSFNNIQLFDIINGKDNFLNEFLELCHFSNENVFKFIISELIDNIFDHANSKNAYVIGCCKKEYFDVL